MVIQTLVVQGLSLWYIWKSDEICGCCSGNWACLCFSWVAKTGLSGSAGLGERDLYKQLRLYQSFNRLLCSFSPSSFKLSVRRCGQNKITDNRPLECNQIKPWRYNKISLLLSTGLLGACSQLISCELWPCKNEMCSWSRSLEIVRWSEMITMRPLMTSGLRHPAWGPSSRPGPLSHTNFSRRNPDKDRNSGDNSHHEWFTQLKRPWISKLFR